MRSLQTRTLIAGSFAAVAIFAGCRDDLTSPIGIASTVADMRHGDDGDGSQGPGRVRCDPDNGGLTLPAGFCAVVVADNLGAARHMAVSPRGDVYVAINQTRSSVPAFGIVALRDADGDGHAEIIRSFNAGKGGSGIAWGGGRLYFGENDQVVRYRFSGDELTPTGGPEVVIGGLPSTGDHISKTIVLRDEHTMFMNIGSASNSCQVANRQLESAGVFPCPELPIRAGVWLVDPQRANQTEADAQHFGTGLRNMVALAVNPHTHELFGVQQGRDMLFENWPQFFTAEESAEMPAEEMVRITRGSNNGWPYCFFDAVFAHRKLLAPEYGGDGDKVVGAQGIDCSTFNQPIATFGAHWSPDGMTFYEGNQFPRSYRDGVFIAFHGGFNRAPLPNEGFNVLFQPMTRDGRPSGGAQVFADGFAGSSGPLPATAKHRPVGVTVGPDGSLYISDDRGGRIWRVVYVGRHED